MVEMLQFGLLDVSSSNDIIESLLKEYGVVYVTSITRDGCSGCAEQKPLFRDLAGRMSEKHKAGVRFSNIHIRYLPDDQKESMRAKTLLGHAAYPTYMVHVRSQFGPLEVYRAVYPSMEELEKQAVEALELAEYYKTESEKDLA